ncbi:uncharacterized protein LOC108035176 [Drosophila biarmipes]|uniref:uncharacterized protein LOC108035176 n=1 Tax=Drosophila biarmipes TaxID=125945 RepID=UPI0007E5CB9F|nr:uncharacterized protein LOC108035176 [Drosophila biarmipes]
MNWIWSLLVLGIVLCATATTEAPSEEVRGITDEPGEEQEEDKYSKLDKKITSDLKEILSKYERECMGNTEFSESLDKVRKAIEGSLEEKLEAKIEFKTYNKQRIDLEKSIDDAIEALNNVLPTLQPNSKCSNLFLKQREALKKAKQLSNSGKSKSLKENTKECVLTDYDYTY